MVPQVGEHLSFIFLGRLPYPLQRLLQPFPILCPAVGLLLRIPLGQVPSLRPLRQLCPSTPFVRRLPRYYAPVRLPLTVHRRITPWIRGSDSVAICAAGPRLSRFPLSKLPCMPRSSTAQRLGGSSSLRSAQCCLPHISRGSALHTLPDFRGSITQPASSPLNACTIPSQVGRHDYGVLILGTLGDDIDGLV